MTHSMTAFTRQQSDHDWGTLVWEIRSVNHRYLEPAFRFPEAFRHLETPCREILRGEIGRGKVEAQLKYVPQQAATNDIDLDIELVDQLKQAGTQIKSVMPECAAPDFLDVLKWPGVILDQGPDADAIEKAALDLFRSALDELLEQRRREGAELGRLVRQRLDKTGAIIAGLREAMPEILKAHQQKLREAVTGIAADLDPARLEQEAALLAQKADIDEEVDRLDTHVREVERTLDQSGPVGRRLDFLMQELNREANTVCSKAAVSETTFSGVELKVLIEQMREQIQNIE